MRVLVAFTVLVIGTTVQVDGFLDVLSYLERCRSRNFDECLKQDLSRTIDDIMNKTETYRINRYMTATVTANERLAGDDNIHKKDVRRSDDLSTRFLDLFNALKIQYQPEVIDQPTDEVFESRKKKKGGKKHKMGMMMGLGSMIISLLGMIILKFKLLIVKAIALKALIIAKIALVLASILMLRKLMGGGGGGGTIVQPVWGGSNGGGGGTDHGGYRRSYADHTDEEQSIMSTASAMAYKEQLGAYNNHAQT